MKKLFSRIFKFFANVQFVQFLLVGGLGTALHYAAFLSLLNFAHVWFFWASLAGFTCGFINNFIWNRYWTFKRTEKGTFKKHLAKFFVISIIGIAFGQAMIYCLVTYLKLNSVLAMLVVTGLVLVWNFAGNKIWTFRIQNYESDTNTTNAPLEGEVN